MNLPDFIMLEQTRKTRDYFRFSHVTRLSKLSMREWTGWMKNQNIMVANPHQNATTMIVKIRACTKF